MDVFLEILAKFIDADKLGGWVRAGTGVLFGAAAGWFGGKLAPFLGPDMQAAVGMVVSTIVVGVWSQLVKSKTAVLTMAANIPEVKRIEVTDPALARATPPEVVMKPLS